MKAVVIGFPKSGTTTIQRALARSGLRAAHWEHQGRPIGKLVYEGLLRHDDPFHFLDGLDVLTQMNYSQPRGAGSFWPNFDLAVLFAIRHRHPDCKLILNYRDATATARSMLRWKNLTQRYEMADMPGLPKGYGTRQDDLVAWIEAMHRGLRAAFAQDPALIEIDIAADDAASRLGRALGINIAWWGVANANPTLQTPGSE